MVARDGVRAVLLAGGQGKRMGGLTRDRLKPLVPFGGQCHLVDFSLANAERTGLPEVLLLSHHNEAQLIGYLRRVWERPGRFRVHFGPHDDALRQGVPAGRLSSRPPERGTAEALLANAEYIFDERHRDVLVLHADHVYSFDYQQMLAHHRATGAALTIGYQRIERQYVRLFGMVEFDDRGWLTRFVEKPDRPTSDLIFSAFCLFNGAVLARYLDQLRHTDWRHDISHDVIPAMLAGAEPIAGFHVPGYWEDIGTVERYHRAHLRLLGQRPTLRPRQMPRTLRPDLPRRHVTDAPGLHDVLLAGDLVNRGSVERSVLYPGVHIGLDARVRDSVLLPGARVADGVLVDRSIVFDGQIVTTDRRDRTDSMPGAGR
jgi:valienol-1-phosphate guanylyltransferase